MGKHFTFAMDEEIRVLVARGKSDDEIGKALDRSRQSIRGRRRLLGLGKDSSKAAGNKGIDWDIADWSGSIMEIARRYGVNWHTVIDAAKQRGIVLKREHSSRTGRLKK